MPYKIIIIEDEQSLRETLKLNLELENYKVESYDSGKKALEELKRFSPDLILLDIMLPEMTGIEVYKKIKLVNNQLPIIFLTAKSDVRDKIEGLKLGADDYITKPFDLEELLLRIQNSLKRHKPNSSVATFKFNSCEINFSTYTVKTIQNQSETLSKREIALLKILTDNLNNVVSRDDILNQLWDKDENPSSRTIDNYILNFRKLFEPNPKEPIHFLSIRGVGYKFCV